MLNNVTCVVCVTEQVVSAKERYAHTGSYICFLNPAYCTISNNNNENDHDDNDDDEDDDDNNDND